MTGREEARAALSEADRERMDAAARRGDDRAEWNLWREGDRRVVIDRDLAGDSTGGSTG